MDHAFHLPEDLNVYNAQDTLEALRLWLKDTAPEPGATLYLQADDVQEMDGAGMQLLDALQNTGYALRVLRPSSKFAQACVLTGKSDWLPGEERA